MGSKQQARSELHPLVTSLDRSTLRTESLHSSGKLLTPDYMPPHPEREGERESILQPKDYNKGPDINGIIRYPNGDIWCVSFCKSGLENQEYGCGDLLR
jgi:hypothetical protein